MEKGRGKTAETLTNTTKMTTIGWSLDDTSCNTLSTLKPVAFQSGSRLLLPFSNTMHFFPPDSVVGTKDLLLVRQLMRDHLLLSTFFGDDPFLSLLHSPIPTFIRPLITYTHIRAILLIISRQLIKLNWIPFANFDITF